MTQGQPSDDVVGYLVETAKAHHAATGGVNSEWANWYAAHLLDDLNEALNADIDAAELAAWLEAADRRYREEPQTASWPKAYAAWLRDDYS